MVVAVVVGRACFEPPRRSFVGCPPFGCLGSFAPLDSFGRPFDVGSSDFAFASDSAFEVVVFARAVTVVAHSIVDISPIRPFENTRPHLHIGWLTLHRTCHRKMRQFSRRLSSRAVNCWDV